MIHMIQSTISGLRRYLPIQQRLTQAVQALEMISSQPFEPGRHAVICPPRARSSSPMTRLQTPVLPNCRIVYHLPSCAPAMWWSSFRKTAMRPASTQTPGIRSGNSSRRSRFNLYLSTLRVFVTKDNPDLDTRSGLSFLLQ